MGSGIRTVALFPAGSVQYFRDTYLQESRDQLDLFYYEACFVSVCRAGINIRYSPDTLSIFFPALPNPVDHSGPVVVDHPVFRRRHQQSFQVA